MGESFGVVSGGDEELAGDVVPTPKCVRSRGAAWRVRVSSSVSSSWIALLSASHRRARCLSARRVASWGSAFWVTRNRAQRGTRFVVDKPRSSPRSGSAAVTTRSRIWSAAWVRALSALERATRSTRIDSTIPFRALSREGSKCAPPAGTADKTSTGNRQAPMRSRPSGPAGAAFDARETGRRIPCQAHRRSHPASRRSPERRTHPHEPHDRSRGPWHGCHTRLS